jgi:uncharacterized protein (DUF305 family)
VIIIKLSVSQKTLYKIKNKTLIKENIMELNEKEIEAMKDWIKAGYTEEEAKMLAKQSMFGTGGMSEITAEDASNYITKIMKKC